MLDEGSPKTSHRDVTIIAVAAAMVMLVASFGAYIEYRAVGRDIQLDIGGAWASFVAVAIVLLMLAWYRGHIASSWPLWGSLGLAAGVLIFIAGDLLTALLATRVGGITASLQMYVVVFAAFIILLACLAGVRRPVVEQSESAGQWRSRREAATGKDERS